MNANDESARRLVDPEWAKGIAQQVLRRHRKQQLKQFSVAITSCCLVFVAIIAYTNRQAEIRATTITDPFSTFYNSGFPDYAVQ